MTRTVYVYDDMSESMVPKEELLARRANDLPPRNWDLAAPMVQGDGMPDAPEFVQSMASGKWYDSKSKLRREYKDLGMIEVGNDRSVTQPTSPRPKKVSQKDKIKASLERAVSQVNLTSYRKDEVPT